MYGSQHTDVKPTPGTTFVVLAGGLGRRLGGIPKGLIRLGGEETTLERLLRLATGPAVVVTQQPWAYERFEVTLVADLVPDRGAPGGVVTGLAMAQTEWVVVVACDMPFLSSALLTELLVRRHAGVDAICFTRDGHLEPLCGVYRRSLCHDWELRLDGSPSMHDLVESVRFEAVECPEPDRLISVNSLDDLRAAESFRRSGTSDSFHAQVPTW